MSAKVDGERESSRPEVEDGVKHVTCTEDAATFVASATAMDLSMDACKLLSQTSLRSSKRGEISGFDYGLEALKG